MQTLTINRPDDWHLHLRDGDLLKDTVPASGEHFARALIMPNLLPPLTQVKHALAYRERILNHVPSFQPYMTLYLNHEITQDELLLAQKNTFILGAKLYPKGATTHSDQGASSVKALYPLLEIMEKLDLVLQIHGEVIHGDIFEREQRFIDEELVDIVTHFPNLRLVLEHISSKYAVDFIRDTQGPIAATITPQHLMFDRNHMLSKGIRPHYYCLPILKHSNDKFALLDAATSNNPKFFAGTDSAPHPKSHKESTCGCAGVFSAPFAVAMYAEVFESMNALQRLNPFISGFGADFYQLPRSTETITLIKKSQIIPETWPLGSELVVPLAAGHTLTWSIHEPDH